MGKPGTRWADVFHRDALQLVGIRGWRRTAEIMVEWRQLKRETKPERSCRAIYGWNIFLKNKNRNTAQQKKKQDTKHIHETEATILQVCYN